ncbi:MAG: LON peptidase substrate-binding domain-containing protein [Candidatus Eiseniibacteriota bacterium]
MLHALSAEAIVEFAPQHPVAVFPLPNVVLFPHTSLPLHIFELRYRTMVREALSSGRLVIMALLKPGWERAERDTPEYHALGCLARIDDVEWLPNDCYDLRVEGLTRVHIGRPITEYPYRSARVELVPQAPYPEDDPLVEIERRALIAACQRWRESPPLPGENPPGAEYGFEGRYEALVNGAGLGLSVPMAEKLAWLSLDSVIERGRLVRECIERRLRSPGSPRGPGASELN